MVTLDRLATVERMVIENGGWNTIVCREIAETLGVHTGTVYDYWNQVKRFARRGMSADVATWRRQQVANLDNIQMEARKNKDYGSATRAIKVQAEILGTLAATNVNVTATTRIDVSPAVVDLVSQRLALASSPVRVAIEAEAEVVEAEVGDPQPGS